MTRQPRASADGESGFICRSILSFQSRVVFGSVGHASAEFALRRLGHDVWPIDTVILSNHPGHGRAHGRTRDATNIADLVEGLAEIGSLFTCAAVLSGYLGSPAIGEVVLTTVDRIRRQRPEVRYCCDPVIGDRPGGTYVDPELARFFRTQARFSADILTPNHFELDTLTGCETRRRNDAVAAARVLLEGRTRLVTVTSVETIETEAECIDTLLIDPQSAWCVTTPKLNTTAKGAGDVLTALFLAHLLAGAAVERALSQAVSSTFALIAASAQSHANELCLVESQQVLETPPKIFPALPVAL